MAIGKDKIVFEFDDPKDAEQVLTALDKYVELTWCGETRKAMIKVFKKEHRVIVSKSIQEVPKPFRL